MKRIAYIRVSTAEQRPDRQISGLREISDELHVETLSAVARRRPVYEYVIASLKETVFVLNDDSWLRGFNAASQERFIIEFIVAGGRCLDCPGKKLLMVKQFQKPAAVFLFPKTV